MRIAVSGSIAEDFLLTFPGRFADMILVDQLDRLSLSFLADGLTHHRGGVGANIAFGMGQLGAAPLLLGAVGADFADGYQDWLESHDVDCAGVYVSDKSTARFLCTTDVAQSQIATFYAGAMADSHLIDLPAVLAAAGPVDLVVVSPAGPEGMLAHTRQAHELGLAVCADPSQQLARMEGPDIVPLIEGARYLVCNDYERGLIRSKTGWTEADLRGQVEVLVTTHGAEGETVEVDDGVVVVAAVAPDPEVPLEPTGAGDAFRAGFLAGLAAEVDVEAAARLGCAVATMALESPGPQGYQIKPADLEQRLAGAYGDAAAEAILAALPIG
jgi:adenosine kinase